MKKLLYSGLMALMMLFAVGSVKAEGTLPSTATSDASFFTITPATGSTVAPGTVLTVTAESNWIVYFAYASQEEADAATIYGFASADEYGLYKEPIINKDQCVFLIAAQDEDMAWKYTYVSYTVEAGDIDYPTFYVNGNYITSRRITATDEISISPEDDDENTQIWYTIDGTTPAKNTGTEYTGKFSLTQEGDVVVKAIAVNSSDQTSAVVEAHFFVGEAIKPQVALYDQAMNEMTSTYGKYVEFYAMAMIDEEPAEQVMVYYTLDGTTEPDMEAYYGQTDPEQDGPVYYVSSDPETGSYPKIMLTQNSVTLKVKAYAMMEGADEPVGSDVETYNLTATTVATPTLTEAAGEVASGTVVKVQNADDYAMILYTLDGSTIPSYDRMTAADNNVYTYDDENGIVITQTVTVNLIAYTATGQGVARVYAGSDMVTATYTVTAPADVTLTFDPASGAEITAGTAVNITASTDVESIYYILYESEAAAKAAAWDQNKAKLYGEGGSIVVADDDNTAETPSKPVPTAALPTIKAAYALPEAEAVAETFFYATYTVNAPAPLDPLAVTFNPASGTEVAENAEITITVNRDNAEINYYVALDSATAYNPNLSFTDFEGYAADNKPVIKKDYTFLRCDVFVDGKTEHFNAHYTIKAGETPDPDKLDVKIEFMTDAYGQARFAKKSDKIRLYMEDPDAVDSMMYAVVAIDADGEETAPTYAKYGEALISLADVEGNFRVKAYAMKDTKTSDVFNADYVLLDIINPTLTFDTMTGKNYPVAFNVHSISYPDIMEKDMYVYYSVDGTTEPSDTAFLNGNTALKYVNKEEGLWKNFLNLQENTTVWAKAYVLLDEGANLVMETPAVKQLVKMNTLDNPVITPAIAATEYNAGDSIKVAIEAPEDAEMVYYTVDGSEPLYSRLVENEDLLDSIIFVYTPSWGDFDTIVVKKSTTVKAIAYKEPAYRPFVPAAGSDIVSATYGFKATLSFNPTSGSTVEEGTKVAITSEDETIDIFYMMFESEEAAKAAEWDQEKAESYNDELQPILTLKNNTIKAAYARHGAEAIVENYFYATYTVTELPDITLTFNPASGSEVKDSTEITVTASRTTEIFYLVYADSAASVADTLFDRNAKEVAEDGKPMITKGNTFLKCAVYNKGEMKYFYASYTVKEEDPIQANEAAELAGVNVYPNPNAGAFNVAVPERARIDIFGLNGAKVMSREVNAGVEAFQLNHSGIYFVRVMAGNKTAVKRVVVR